MKAKTRNRTLFGVLLMLLVIGVVTYLTINTRGNWAFAYQLRSGRIAAFLLVGISTTVATIVFQTITQNQILTPNIIGLDALYVLFQTATVFFLGMNHPFVLNTRANFIISSLMMVLGSMALYWIFFKKYPGRVYLLLMTGLILGNFMGSFNTFLQVLIDPNEFDSVLARSIASFNNVDTTLTWVAALICAPVLIYLFRQTYQLDVLHLGRDHARGLGIDVDRLNLTLFILISLLTAISTALVGPVTFLGFLGANISYRLFKTYQHAVLFAGGSLLTIVFIFFGQTAVEHIFRLQTTLGVVIEFVGGVYFLFILLRERNR